MLRYVVPWMLDKDYAISHGEKRHGKARETAGSQKRLHLGHVVDPGAVLQGSLQAGENVQMEHRRSASLLTVLPSGIHLHSFH